MPPGFKRYFLVYDPHGFDWDPAKSDRNFEARGFDFGFAKQVFRGEMLRRRDTRRSDEDVFQVLGEVSGVILFVVYATRRGRIRIISARVATAEEAKLYHDR
ncbi:MAG TPA: BrnT family toxin [Azospirillaceae bacterium]|nr:BrnT family toxin [Azospirillaceae bacterium]